MHNSSRGGPGRLHRPGHRRGRCRRRRLVGVVGRADQECSRSSTMTSPGSWRSRSPGAASPNPRPTATPATTRRRSGPQPVENKQKPRDVFLQRAGAGRSSSGCSWAATQGQRAQCGPSSPVTTSPRWSPGPRRFANPTPPRSRGERHARPAERRPGPHR